MTNNVLISSIGWEPRFLMGIKDIAQTIGLPGKLIFFHPTDVFRDHTNVIKQQVYELAQKHNSEIHFFDYTSADHVNTWRAAEEGLSNLCQKMDVLLDITTMPRHLIWNCLHFLDHAKCLVHCLYYPPEQYGSWLSSDTGQPKLAFRHSGIALPNRETCLVLFSGFEATRAQRFVDYFEPRKIILVVHSGGNFNNEERRVDSLITSSEIQKVFLNAYEPVQSLLEQLKNLIAEDIDKFNVIATTIGPRCSSISLYALNRAFPEIGLVYASAHQYNTSYSNGINIAEKFVDVIDFGSATSFKDVNLDF